MPLSSGRRLGPYEIVSPLGAGGMGEVYRARDSKLQRDVAIKILPELVALEPDRLARFAREAQLLAALNHPHIASIYGLEDSDGVPALVMELVEGPTLGEMIDLASTSSGSRGSGSGQPGSGAREASGSTASRPAPGRRGLPLGEVLPIARQIALALEAAHEQGIVHRDLKPANVKVRPDGTVKVLDFGLAKALRGDLAQGEAAHSPTLTARETQMGVILGTAAYMSPEQARGKAVDRRTDVWAFGAVLFEMLTGTRAFQGAEITDILAKVIEREPDWSALPATTPRAVVKLLHRCLEKNPSQRLHDMGDARLEIEEALGDPDAPAAAAPASAAPGSRPWLLVAAPLALVAAAAIGWFARRPPAAAPTPVVRFAIPAPATAAFDRESFRFPGAVLSPDGSRLVVRAVAGNTSKLFLRRLDRLEATLLTGTDHGFNPFFSPDGRWVAFTADRKLRKVSLDGGSPLIIGDATWGGGAWAADDTIIFTPNYQSGLWRIPGGGGTPTKLTEPDQAQHELGHFWPQVLPDGKHVLFTAFSTPIERSRIAVCDLATGQVQTVVQGGTYARYLPTGHLVYARTESVVAVPFELSTLKVNGAPVPVMDDVLLESPNGVVQISFAANGTMAYVPASLADVPTALVWVDRAGVTTPVTAAKRRFYGPEFSRSGRRLAVTIHDENRDLWIYELERDLFTRLTSGPASEFGARWDKDDRRILFVSEQPVYQVFTQGLSTAAVAEPLVAGANDTTPTSISTDGTVLLYTESYPATGDDIMKIALTPGAKPEVVVRTPFQDRQAMLSPDARWMAYVSDDSGRDEIYVQAFPKGEERWQVSTDGGNQPRWARDGRELFFVSPGRFIAVPIVPGSTFAFGKPQTLFEGNFRHITDAGYDVAPDGKRFIMIQRDPAAPPITVSVVLNWFDELRAKVPR